ncbi:MAG: hypothetical protein GX762_08280 [Bacteroidales bacterium]|nr:hypothetical protein [Bacteroidales bacterium]
MKRFEKTIILGLIIILLLFVSLCSYGQSRQEKTKAIIDKLNIVDVQKMNYEYRLEPLKYHAIGRDSVRLVELEKQLTEENFLKVVNEVFEEYLNDEEIDNIYSFLQSSVYEKLFDPAVIFKAIYNHYSYINEEIDSITNSLDESIRSPDPIFEPLATDREDGFYLTKDDVYATGVKEIILDDKPSFTSKDILEVKKISYDDKHTEISIQFTKEAAQKFYSLTKINRGKPLAIVLGKQIVSMPTINDAILGGRANITGNFTDEEIDEMIVRLKEKE